MLTLMLGILGLSKIVNPVILRTPCIEGVLEMRVSPAATPHPAAAAAAADGDPVWPWLWAGVVDALGEITLTTCGTRMGAALPSGCALKLITTSRPQMELGYSYSTDI